MTRPRTLGDLKNSEWCEPSLHSMSVKQELREGVIRRLETGDELFPGIVGYQETVIPQLTNAILAKHDFILLGLRGQAKSRIIRSLIQLLSDAIPAVSGSEVNDNPFAPISQYARNLIEECGDATPIKWLRPSDRFVEKLATLVVEGGDSA